MTPRHERFQFRFDQQYGKGKWERFCQLVWQSPRPRPGDVQKEFPAESGKPMSRPTYYKWEARAWEVAGSHPKPRI